MAALGSPGMGIGRMGNPDVIYKRQFRFEMTVFTPGNGVVPPSFVKTSGRPSITFEETELNHLNEKVWIPGKPTWETITATYIDAAVPDIFPLYNWMASVYNFTNPNRFMGSRQSDYAGSVLMFSYDGCGQILEEWRLGNVWPQSMNFNANPYDYAGSETLDVELTLRYSNVVYIAHCPSFTPSGVCSPCGSR